MSGLRATAVALVVLAVAAVPVAAQEPLAVRAGLDPGVVELGERALYRGWVVGPNRPGRMRWLAPEPDERLTWGTATVSRRQGGNLERVPAAGWYGLHDTVFIEIPVQAFQLGQITLPGLRFEVDAGGGGKVHRLPTTTLTVSPIIAASDTTADFRAPHGPLAAPWWERVPWTWVALGALALAVLLLFVRWWRRRRRAPVAAPAPALALDPLAEALAALAALRALQLPEHGRFAEHAFRLGQILRRYLEAVTRTTRPGDTTPELLRHLRQAGLPADDLTRLEGLLRVWDRVKFAREPFTRDEAERAEAAVETFLKRPAPLQRVA